MTWQEDIIGDAERQIAWAKSQMPDDEIPLTLLGDHPPAYRLEDRHRIYEEDFNALAQAKVDEGLMTPDEAAAASADFHIWVSSNRFQPPQTSPYFYQ